MAAFGRSKRFKKRIRWHSASFETELRLGGHFGVRGEEMWLFLLAAKLDMPQGFLRSKALVPTEQVAREQAVALLVGAAASSMP